MAHVYKEYLYWLATIDEIDGDVVVIVGVKQWLWRCPVTELLTGPDVIAHHVAYELGYGLDHWRVV